MTFGIEGLGAHIRFSAPISPLQTDRAVLKRADGTEIPVRRRIGMDFRDLWLIPLDGESRRDAASVSFNGLEDRSGRPVERSAR